MSLKDRFLIYVELQRNARSILLAYGPDDSRVIAAYEKANEQKRKVLTEIEELEYRMESLEK